MKQGLLLINLGTPDSPDVKDVRRYLKQFLSDPYVIDLPTPLRMILLYGVILPFRPKQAAEAYSSIWQKEGSPLLLFSRELQEKLQEKLCASHKVVLGMRYGNPSIDSAIDELKDCQSITILPLFPQYSSAATGSALAAASKALKSQGIQANLNVIQDFYDHPGFIEPMAAQIQPYLVGHEHVLFSYHGLPERQILKEGCDNVCDSSCPAPKPGNKNCYRAQCYATSRALSSILSLAPDMYSTTFQSRLGRIPWIQPYTDEVLPNLAKSGIKNLLVACPSFTADCLETLEEIGIRAKEQWLECGGEKLTLVPCVNATPQWLDGIQDIISQPHIADTPMIEA